MLQASFRFHQLLAAALGCEVIADGSLYSLAPGILCENVRNNSPNCIKPI